MMELKWIKNIPTDPQEFFYFFKKKYSLSPEDIFKLYFITLEIKALSDAPIYKFLERIPCYVKFDEIGKRKYLLSLSLHTLRNLIKEHLDLKFIKTLYLFLSQKLPKEFFKGCAPKHSIIASQDILCELLSDEKRAKLPAYLKVKHFPLVFSFSAECEQMINILPFCSLYTLKKLQNAYTMLFTSSISEFIVFSQHIKDVFKEHKELREQTEHIIENLKIFFPDCFGEI